MTLLRDFYRGKRVLVTGHTGFKGSWLCEILKSMDAEVIGYALEPPTEPSLFEIGNISDGMTSVIGDIRDLFSLKKVFEMYQPEIVIHMAAQPIVRESYLRPVDTYEVNVMGTVNLLECIRLSTSVKSVVNVTTDKVYRNKEWDWGYRENDVLDGFDPYSNSKSCSELVTGSYIRSFFAERNCSISTARAGNVIGGGDFAKDRIIPDCARAVMVNQEIVVRNPYAIRPYQLVLEPLFAYLLIAMKQYAHKEYQGNYNIGPGEYDCVTTGKLVEMFCELWGEQASWREEYQGGPHEAKILKLDCSYFRNRFHWKAETDIQYALEETVTWYKAYAKGKDVSKVMQEQIRKYKMKSE